MIQSIKISDAPGIFSPALQTLYETSFPLHERRSWDSQMALYNNGLLKLYIIENESAFIGFVFYWQLSNFIFVEHFATAPEWRGRGAGAFVVNWLMEKHTNIVLEVELPDAGTEAARRMQFYERLGFRRFDAFYAQPPYHPGNAFTPMLLLQSAPDNNQPKFENIKSEIYRVVYGRLS